MTFVRSALSSGVATGLVFAGAGVAVLTPTAVAPVPALASPAVQLSAAVAALPQSAAALPSIPEALAPAGPAGSAGEWIINGYNAVQPWIQYGVQLGAWAVGWLPWPISLAAAQMNIAYSSVEPVSQALVYSLAYLIDGQFELIGPTIANGVQTGFNNFVQGEIGWLAGFFPPLPPIPFPVFPGAATAPPPASAAAVPVTAETQPVTADSQPVQAAATAAPARTGRPPVRPARTAPAAAAVPAAAAAETVAADADADPVAPPASDPTANSTTGRTDRAGRADRAARTEKTGAAPTRATKAVRGMAGG